MGGGEQKPQSSGRSELLDLLNESPETQFVNPSPTPTSTPQKISDRKKKLEEMIIEYMNRYKVDEKMRKLPGEAENKAVDPGIFRSTESEGVPSGEGDVKRGTDKKVYSESDLKTVIDALNRIGIFELARPPEFLGRRYMPVNHILPMYPVNTMPEDIMRAF